MDKPAVDDRPRKRTIFLMVTMLAALLALSLVGHANAESKLVKGNAINPEPSTSSVAPSLEVGRLTLDRERLDFEKQKAIDEIKMAQEKLVQERTTAVWSAASTTLPFLAAFFTFGYSIWSFRKQATETARLQNESSKLQFEIKAAEIAFSGKSPKAVENRGIVLKKMFGERLPQNFPAPFDAEAHGGGKEAPAEKLAFLELLLKYPSERQKIVEFWSALFSDPWLERIRPIIIQQPGGSQSGDDETNPKGTSMC
jgi:hypothetical protein